MFAAPLQPAAGDGPEDREGVEADAAVWPGQRAGDGGSAQHRGAADQRAEKSEKRKHACVVRDVSAVCDARLLLLQEFHRLQDENIQLKNICEDQERALEELGSKLSEYVLLKIHQSVLSPLINTKCAFYI